MSQLHECEKPVWTLWHDLHDNQMVTTHKSRLCFVCGGIEKEAVATGEVTFELDTD